MSTWETASVCSTDWGLHRLLFWPSFCNCEMWSMFPLSCYPCTVLTGCYPALFLDIFLLINNPYLSPLNALQQTTYTHCMCLGSFGESLLCKDSPQNLNNILKHIHTSFSRKWCPLFSGMIFSILTGMKTMKKLQCKLFPSQNRNENTVYGYQCPGSIWQQAPSKSINILKAHNLINKHHSVHTIRILVSSLPVCV